jgi:hypothetical protein
MCRGGQEDGNPKTAHRKYFICPRALQPVKMVKYSDIVRSILKSKNQINENESNQIPFVHPDDHRNGDS